MLTIKVPDQKEYFIPENCVYCNAKRQNSQEIGWLDVPLGKVSKFVHKHNLRYFRCPKCGNLQSRSLLYTQILPMLILMITYALNRFVLRNGIIPNNLVGVAILMPIVFLVIWASSTLGQKLANNYLTKNGYKWGASSITKGPVRKNRKIKEKGYLVLDFTNEDYARSFAELNHGVVITKH